MISGASGSDVQIPLESVRLYLMAVSLGTPSVPATPGTTHSGADAGVAMARGGAENQRVILTCCLSPRADSCATVLSQRTAHVGR
jgi:hypothetical protein